MVLKRWLMGACLGVALVALGTPAQAGTLGFPAPRLQPLHFRFELVGDGFEEKLNKDAESETGRALLTAAFGPTAWSEIYARVGMANFEVDEDLFNGRFGFAYGGGLRLRLFSFALGDFGVAAQYLRFTSNDHDSAGEFRRGKWREFDLTAGFGTKRFGVFQFYTGGAFHHSDITIDGGSSATVDLETRIPFRFLIGINIYPLLDFPGGDFVVNVEARIIGEIPRFTLGVQYAF
jgi:hypothetical protein